MYRCCTLQAFVSLNWVLAEEPLDLETELALDFLDYLLVHTPLLLWFHCAVLFHSCTSCLPVVHAAARRQAANVRWPRVQVGTSAAPLRKELMDSGLGEALVGGGLQGDLRQPVFSIGLKGAAPENFQKVDRGAAGCPPC